MPECPESSELARAVVERVAARHPQVDIRWWGASDSYHGTIVGFEPGGRAAPLLLYVNFDRSFQLESGRFILAEDEPTHGELDQQAEQITAIIDSLARRGVERNWLDRLIGARREAVEPWPS